MDFSMPLMDSCNPGWNNPSPLKAKIKTKKKGEYHDNLSVIYIIIYEYTYIPYIYMPFE